MVNSIPGIYQWYLPIFTDLENTPKCQKPAITGQLNFSALKHYRNLNQVELKKYTHIIKLYD